MPTFVHGKNTVILINGTDISEFSNNTQDSDETETHESTTYGRSRKTYVAGLGDGTFEIGGFHASGVSGAKQVLKPLKAAGTPVSFQYRPEGTGSGLPESQVDVIVQSYQETDPVGGLIEWQATLQKTGTLDDTAQ